MKIDITKIEGYRDDMTVEEKLELVLGYEIPEPDYSGYVKKSVFDKTASELADVKKQLKAKMSEDEIKEAERQAAEQSLREEIESLRKYKAISEHTARLLEIGYAADLAADTAKALVEGDMEKVFKNQQKHIENVKKAERAAALGRTPEPPAGGSNAVVDKASFDALSSAEQIEFIRKNPNWKEIVGFK